MSSLFEMTSFGFPMKKWSVYLDTKITCDHLNLRFRAYNAVEIPVWDDHSGGIARSGYMIFIYDESNLIIDGLNFDDMSIRERILFFPHRMSLRLETGPVHNIQEDVADIIDGYMKQNLTDYVEVDQLEIIYQYSTNYLVMLTIVICMICMIVLHKKGLLTEHSEENKL